MRERSRHVKNPFGKPHIKNGLVLHAAFLGRIIKALSESGGPLPDSDCQALCLRAEGDTIGALSNDGVSTEKKQKRIVPDPANAWAV